jgi:predicted acylesterase/phospholipase RssA
MIEHIVMSGGGPNGVLQLGMLKVLQEAGFFRLSDLKGVYATSAGAILAAFILLDVPLDDACEYMVKRPWNKWLKLDVMALNESKGLVDNRRIKEVLIPFFTVKNVPLDITLSEFYQRVPVDFHMYCTNLKTLALVDLSHSTHPTLPLLKAITMSSAFIPLFTPILHDGVYYVDGGIRNNFPINFVPKDAAKDTVLAINMIASCAEFNFDQMSILDLFFYFMFNAMIHVSQAPVRHEIALGYKYYAFFDVKSVIKCAAWTDFIEQEDYRQKMLDQGVELGKEFRSKWVCTESSEDTLKPATTGAPN